MSCGEGKVSREACVWWKDGLCACTEAERREYAVRNPYNTSGIITVPDNSLENALKLVDLVPDSVIMTRTVTEWVEHVQP